MLLALTLAPPMLFGSCGGEGADPHGGGGSGSGLAGAMWIGGEAGAGGSSGASAGTTSRGGAQGSAGTTGGTSGATGGAGAGGSADSGSSGDAGDSGHTGGSGDAGSGADAGSGGEGGADGSVGEAGSANEGGQPGSGGMDGSAGAWSSGGMDGGAGVDGSAGDGGSGGMGESMLKGPIVRGSKCVLEFGDLYFEVDAAVAGRISSARLGGDELLTTPAVHETNYGSTFWTSPQADWGWPPVADIDSAPFTVSAEGHSCTLVGPRVDLRDSPAVHQLRLSKKFTADLLNDAVEVDYTLRNEGRDTKRLAPWEITRVPPYGLTFFATDSAPTGSVVPPITREHGCVWFRYEDSVRHHAKLYADGNGWIAHVTTDDLLLIKTFPDLAPRQAAEGEAEIEVYASNPPDAPSARYAEVENQGAFTELRPGAALTWSVRWYLRKLPRNLTATPSAELLAFVQRTVQ